MVKKIKKIIAQALLVTMVLPNISARAIENTSIDASNEIMNNIEVNDVVIEESNYNEITDENSGNNALIEDNSEEKVNEELQLENESNEVSSEKEPMINDEYEIEIFSSNNNAKITGNEDMSIISTYSMTNYEREEFELKAQEIQTYSRLVNKTDANYEIAMAHEDGSYTYLDSVENIDDAMYQLEHLVSAYSEDNSQPVIVNSEGMVVYSTYSMARIYKHINGSPYPYFDKNSNLYSDAGLTKAFTYINQGYVDDAPILEFNGSTSAKILVSGYEGWINMNTSAAEYDMIVVPINQVKNPSYYSVKNGVLYHFISSNLTSGSSGYSIQVGKAPSYLVQGKYYFSYDGKYFYDGSNITTGMTTLINDYKNGVNSNAINANNPYYSYYQNLPFRSKTIYSAEELNEFIAANTVGKENSKLRNTGQALKDAEKTYGVNALLALGIAINESAWGVSSIALSKNNIFGLNAVDSNPGMAADQFASAAACISDFAKNWISRGYADPADWRYYGGFLGNKKLGTNIKYASDPYWGEKAAQYALQADLYLSGSVNSLKDTDAYQLAIYTSPNQVWNSKGTLLYKVNDNFSEYSSYVGVPVVVTDPNKVYINGRESYEIYADRNTSVGSGGTANMYHGNYDWSDKGYVSTTGVQFINSKRNVNPPLDKIGGSDRYSTGVELSKSQFKSATTAVIVNCEALIDGITATALATAANGPVLLTESTNVRDVVKNELKRLGVTKVILVGGEGILGQGVINDLKSIGINNITRLGGLDRYDTALQVAKYIDSTYYDVSEVFLVNGYGEADALSAGPISGQNKIPILLTKTEEINANVKSWLASESLTNGYVIGGEGVISNNVLNQLNSLTSKNVLGNRLGGINRFDTNAQIIDRFYGSKLNSVYVTKGYELIDALTAGPIAALNGSPIVIVDELNSKISDKQKSVLSVRYTSRIIQAGLNVDQKAIESIRNILNIYDL